MHNHKKIPSLVRSFSLTLTLISFLALTNASLANSDSNYINYDYERNTARNPARNAGGLEGSNTNKNARGNSRVRYETPARSANTEPEYSFENEVVAEGQGFENNLAYRDSSNSFAEQNSANNPQYGDNEYGDSEYCEEQFEGPSDSYDAPVAPAPKKSKKRKVRSYNQENSFSYDSSNGCKPIGLIGLIFDEDFSPVTGGSFFISVLRGYMLLDDYLFPNTEGDTNAYMILGRLAKFAIEGTVLNTMMVAEHEIFGHGWRAREFDVPIFAYRIRPFSGYTILSSSAVNQLLFTEQAAISTGGMEANSILAKQIRNHWLPCQALDEREGLLYILTSMDQTHYVIKTGSSSVNTFSDGNDVIHYVNEVNNWYQRQVLTRQELRSKAWIDFLDPYLWYSAYSVGRFVYNGTQCLQYPMIPICDYKYLPGMRLALAPYGPEYQLINYIISNDLDFILQATLRYGHTGDKKSAGITLERSCMWCAGDLMFDGRLDVWAQPKVLVAYSDQASRRFGAALSVTGHYRIINCLEIMAQAGYKMSGYMPGEALKRGAILRIGFGFYL